ncbi:nitrogenase-stabilizing/protective protein NifW [Salmonella enterica]
MEWFYRIAGLDQLDNAESFFDFFCVPYDPHILQSCCLPLLRDFHRRLREYVPLRNLLEEDPRAPWLLARRLLAESYQHFSTGAQNEATV